MAQQLLVHTLLLSGRLDARKNCGTAQRLKEICKLKGEESGSHLTCARLERPILSENREKKKNGGEMNDISLYGPSLICVLFCIQIPVQRQAVMES